MNAESCLCERCGAYIPPFRGKKIAEPWQKFGVVDICEKCGDKANKFLNYWGLKKPKDIESLRKYLQSGYLCKKETADHYNQLTQAGYY